MSWAHLDFSDSLHINSTPQHLLRIPLPTVYPLPFSLHLDLGTLKASESRVNISLQGAQTQSWAHIYAVELQHFCSLVAWEIPVFPSNKTHLELLLGKPWDFHSYWEFMQHFSSYSRTYLVSAEEGGGSWSAATKGVRAAFTVSYDSAQRGKQMSRAKACKNYESVVLPSPHRNL